MTQVLPYLWYPAFFVAALAMFWGLLGAGAAPAVAAYPPIVIVAIAIIILELRFPERIEWRPLAADIKADAAFMVIVQVALPRLLALLGILAISSWMHAHAQSTWWPHDWPLVAQMVAMVLAVDFMRYWLHRACHRYDLLWRLHEVHHSPDILYMLNVARFHPIEKVLHFMFDAVPFLLLGVAPEVIAGYFLLYSVNGLFQHSNLRLRYGWLNYIVGSAETHRWHHARNPKTASCNFGNTTIIWDLLFGTWHLPKDRQVDEIGIMNRMYPKSFCAQMIAPFCRRDSHPRRSFKAWLADVLVKVHLHLIRLIQERRIAVTINDPMRIQHALLARILHENRNTTFGRRHHFASIDSHEKFTAHVPINDYESLRPFIDAEIENGENALTAEVPLRYVRTSGTTGRPKDIPLTRTHLFALRRIHKTAVAFQHRTCPEAFAGGILAIVSPATEGMLTNGKPFGSASGIVARNTPAAIREKFVVPAEVMTITDSRLKYLLILRLALARRDITYLGTANPSTLLMLIKIYHEHTTSLIKDLRHGTFFLSGQLPQTVLAAVQRRLYARPERADELNHLHTRDTPVRIADLWPDLRLIVSWTCASAGIAADAVRRELASHTKLLELGYVSSEFRGTITIGRNVGTGFPTLDTHFFEFVERTKWDDDKPEFLTLDRIHKGIDYYLVVTTPSGLYRYFINDLVRVKGFLGKTPLLKFMQKGKGVTNITGEKLYETQVLAAVRITMADYGRAACFLMMLADEENRRYRLYVESDAGPKPDATALGIAVDAKLAELNVEYQSKRESARLGPIEAHWLATKTGDAYKNFCVEQGQREGQFKIVAVAYCKDFHFDLEAHMESC